MQDKVFSLFEKIDKKNEKKDFVFVLGFFLIAQLPPFPPIILRNNSEKTIITEVTCLN